MESQRFVALRSQYGSNSFFRGFGKDGAHEKDGVAAEIGRFCRRHLVPVPNVASLAELNTMIATGDLLRRHAGDYRSRHDGRRGLRRQLPI